MTESKSTDKLKLLLDFAEKNISKVEIEKIKTLSLTWGHDLCFKMFPDKLFIQGFYLARHSGRNLHGGNLFV